MELVTHRLSEAAEQGNLQQMRRPFRLSHCRLRRDEAVPHPCHPKQLMLQYGEAPVHSDRSGDNISETKGVCAML